MEEKKKNPKAFVNYKVVEFKPSKKPTFIKRKAESILKIPKNFRTKLWKNFGAKKDIEIMVKS